LKYYQIVHHANVLKLIDGGIVAASDGSRDGLLLFPFYKRGTLQDLIQKQERVELAVLMKYFSGICAGLIAFHTASPALAFRDLKVCFLLKAS
jgi:serine/threonine protein kinase